MGGPTQAVSPWWGPAGASGPPALIEAALVYSLCLAAMMALVFTAFMVFVIAKAVFARMRQLKVQFPSLHCVNCCREVWKFEHVVLKFG